jgi:hypothetical protein
VLAYVTQHLGPAVRLADGSSPWPGSRLAETIARAWIVVLQFMGY